MGSKIIDNEKGASLVEYALLLALIALVALGAIPAVGSNASAQFRNMGEALHDPGSCSIGADGMTTCGKRLWVGGE